MSERIHKVLAQLGLGSRREIETWIKAGRVIVNGQVASLGQAITIDKQTEIKIDGQAIDLRNIEFDAEQVKIPVRVLLYNKPTGVICTRKDPQDRKTVFDKLPPIKVGRWISVGRLDINTTGLILLTTDGELANRLMHPRHQIERKYAVRVCGEVTEAMLQRLKTGVQLDEDTMSFETIEATGGEANNRWYHVTLREGKYREVRRLWESQGKLSVSRLIRIQYGPIYLPKTLRTGRWQELKGEVLAKLYRAVDLPAPNGKPILHGFF